MYQELASLVKQGVQNDNSDKSSQSAASEEKKQSDESADEDDDDDFGTDRDIDWTDARQRKKSPFRGVATEPHPPHHKNALQEEIKHIGNEKEYFDHTLQTI